MIPAAISGGLVLTSAVALMRLVNGRHRRDVGLSAGPSPAPPAPRWFARRVEVAGVALEVSSLWLRWLTGIPAACLIGWWIGGSGCAALMCVVWLVTPVALPPQLARRAATRREEAVPQALDAIARALRSGASLLQALEEAASQKGPLQDELQRVVAEAQRGNGVAAALDGWARRQPSGSIRLAAAALSLGAETGGANARAVDGVAATVRQRLAVAGEARALTAQPRVSAQVIGLAPLAFGAFSAATDPALARLLFTTPVGWAMLSAGLLLDLAGLRWMMRMARS